MPSRRHSGVCRAPQLTHSRPSMHSRFERDMSAAEAKTEPAPTEANTELAAAAAAAAELRL